MRLLPDQMLTLHRVLVPRPIEIRPQGALSSSLRPFPPRFLLDIQIARL